MARALRPRASGNTASWLPPKAVWVNTSAMTKRCAIYQAERNARFTSAIRFSSRL
jgi:hypothetical protein